MIETAWSMSAEEGVAPLVPISAVNTAEVPPARSMASRGCVAWTPNIVAYSATRTTPRATSGRHGRWFDAPRGRVESRPEYFLLRAFFAATFLLLGELTCGSRAPAYPVGST